MTKSNIISIAKARMKQKAKTFKQLREAGFAPTASAIKALPLPSGYVNQAELAALLSAFGNTKSSIQDGRKPVKARHINSLLTITFRLLYPQVLLDRIMATTIPPTFIELHRESFLDDIIPGLPATTVPIKTLPYDKELKLFVETGRPARRYIPEGANPRRYTAARPSNIFYDITKLSTLLKHHGYISFHPNEGLILDNRDHANTASASENFSSSRTAGSSNLAIPSYSIQDVIEAIAGKQSIKQIEAKYNRAQAEAQADAQRKRMDYLSSLKITTLKFKDANEGLSILLDIACNSKLKGPLSSMVSQDFIKAFRWPEQIFSDPIGWLEAARIMDNTITNAKIAMHDAQQSIKQTMPATYRGRPAPRKALPLGDHHSLPIRATPAPKPPGRRRPGEIILPNGTVLPLFAPTPPQPLRPTPGLRPATDFDLAISAPLWEGTLAATETPSLQQGVYKNYAFSMGTVSARAHPIDRHVVHNLVAIDTITLHITERVHTSMGDRNTKFRHGQRIGLGVSRQLPANTYAPPPYVDPEIIGALSPSELKAMCLHAGPTYVLHNSSANRSSVIVPLARAFNIAKLLPMEKTFTHRTAQKLVEVGLIPFIFMFHPNPNMRVQPAYTNELMGSILQFMARVLIDNLMDTGERSVKTPMFDGSSLTDLNERAYLFDQQGEISITNDPMTLHPRFQLRPVPYVNLAEFLAVCIIDDAISAHKDLIPYWMKPTSKREIKGKVQTYNFPYNNLRTTVLQSNAIAIQTATTHGAILESIRNKLRALDSLFIKFPDDPYGVSQVAHIINRLTTNRIVV